MVHQDKDQVRDARYMTEDGVVYSEVVDIPTNQSFLEEWHWWIYKKVARHFKRDKERILDTTQSVRLRLLSKDFIGRWFFKHLHEELVDTAQAERMLGLSGLICRSEIDPAVGRRAVGGRGGTRAEGWLWRVSDLLAYAEFDRERYYYSPQGHTIESDKVLELLGRPAGSYGILESLYRQGRLKPAELTEHACTGDRRCLGCAQGRATLRLKDLSLDRRWDNPMVEEAVRRLRWNDLQLEPFLREGLKKSRIQGPPAYIMRPEGSRGVIAGLLKYTQNIIDNEVVNDFKRLSRSADMTQMIFNNGVSPERPNSETVAWEVDDESERVSPVFCDAEYASRFEQSERYSDIRSLICRADLTEEEEAAILAVDLMEMTARQYADSVGQVLGHVHSVRASAFRKLRGLRPDAEVARRALDEVCDLHGCTPGQVLGPDLFGPCVRARTDLFSRLSDTGMSAESISFLFSYPEERVVAAINRKCLQEMRQ